AGPVRNESANLTLTADVALAEVPPPDIVLVPGGPGTEELADGAAIFDWLRTADQPTSWTTSVCTGSLILARAGLLTGRRATTHWTAEVELGRLGAEAVSERGVVGG